MDVKTLIDYNAMCFGLMYGSVMKEPTLSTNEDREQYFKYCIVNRLALIQKKLQADETIICCDSRSWRRDWFKYYKANRDLHRAEKPLEYEFLYGCIDRSLDLLRELNCKVLKVEKCEADDIIACICQTYRMDEIIICSHDKDFQQLTSDRVKLYNYSQDEILNCEDRDRFTIELILKGDSADGIPNVFSDDDTFIVKEKRQKPVTKKKINEILMEGIENICKRDMAFARNFDRNKKLILLDETTIPADIYSSIKSTYNLINENYKRKNIVEIGNILRKYGITMMDNVNYLV